MTRSQADHARSEQLLFGGRSTGVSSRPRKSALRHLTKHGLTESNAATNPRSPKGVPTDRIAFTACSVDFTSAKVFVPVDIAILEMRDSSPATGCFFVRNGLADD